MTEYKTIVLQQFCLCVTQAGDIHSQTTLSSQRRPLCMCGWVGMEKYFSRWHCGEGDLEISYQI